MIYSYTALNEFADIFARYLTAGPETQESKVSYSKKKKKKNKIKKGESFETLGLLVIIRTITSFFRVEIGARAP